MTPNAIIAAVAVGLFVLSCLVGWQIILTLRQARSTALALEQFLNGTRPKIEAVGERIDAFVGHADRVLSIAEQGGTTSGAILRVVGQALSGWTAGVQAVSTISELIARFVQAWPRQASAPGTPGAAPAPAGGTSHE